MRVSCFKGYSLCIFIVFSCIGILTDCLLFWLFILLWIYVNVYVGNAYIRVRQGSLCLLRPLYLLSQLFQYLLYFLKELSYVRSVHKSMVYSESDGHYQSSFAWHYFAGIHQRIV